LFLRFFNFQKVFSLLAILSPFLSRLTETIIHSLSPFLSRLTETIIHSFTDPRPEDKFHKKHNRVKREESKMSIFNF
jgi:hypothetical protein